MSLFSSFNPNFVLGHRVSQHWTSLVGYTLLVGVNLAELAAYAQTFFLALWIIAEILRNGRLAHSRTPLGSPSRIALLEATKLTISVGVHLWRRRHASTNTHSRHSIDVQGEEETLYGLSPDGSQTSGRDSPPIPVSSYGSLREWTGRSVVYIYLLAALYSLRNYFALASGKLADPLTLYLAIPLTTVFSIIALRLCFSQSYSAGQCQAVLLQLCGILIVRGNFNQDLSRPSFSIFFALALSGTLALVSTDFIYKLHDTTSINTLNITLFAFSTIISGLFALTHHLGAINQYFYSASSDLLSIALLLAEAGRDITALSVLFHFDAVLLGVAGALGSAVVLAASASIAMLSSVIVFTGCFVTFVGSISYMFCHRTCIDEGVESTLKIERIRYKTSVVSFVVSLLFVAIIAFHEGMQYSISYTPSLWSALTPQSALPSCQRKPLASLSYYSQTRKYHEFDNILLIVFFSHARYNVNLDNYKKVYSKYFPNMIFIGPASREDAGFSHSYDVLVDSYESDEDLKNSTHYKMAGRMAHHMLYTAMMQHDCYDGYLWAPFDTLLNIPRLQQFDQRFFWYHSPWGTFIPNPAFPHAKDNMDKARHAPPAIISPDPHNNLTETWRGWQKDWWWGDPQVGVGVCMTAFQRVPLEMRERMAEFTDGQTRLIGGSADTLYIPGRHRQIFMDTLGLFLETDCFLEIATPTTVHLVVPPQEPILFVDHWWIWEPPFNSSFVRQKWAEGREVDTFHTFHWGDKGTDGVWRENPDNIDDVRSLLLESAARQRVDLP